MTEGMIQDRPPVLPRAPVSRRELQYLFETLVRIETKQETVLQLTQEMTALRRDVAELNVRVVKLESWQTFALWVVGGLWALTVALSGSAFAYLLTHMR